MQPRITACGAPSADTFFTEVCAKLLRARASQARHAGGRFAFQLKGKGGATWLIDLGKALVLKNPSSQSADVVVSMAVGDFEALLARQLDPHSALGDQRITISGERSRLMELGPILGPLGPED